MYYLPEEAHYLCGRAHVVAIWPDGRKRRFFISERIETNRPPWPIPNLVEERELLNEDITETWLTACKHPEDFDLTDVKRHFGYGAPGLRHLSYAQVVAKYSPFVLELAQT